MKILVVNSSLRIGGAESMSVELANGLAADGHDVGFAAAGGPLRDNIDARVDYVRTTNPNDAPFRAARQLVAHMKAAPPDVVHSHGGTCSWAASMATRRVRPRPLRVLTHHSRIFRKAPAWIGTIMMKRVADHFVAISTDKETALKEMGVPVSRVTRIPNFVDTDDVKRRVEATDGQALRRLLEIPDRARVISIAGRVLPEKGFDHFARIVERTAQVIGDELHGIAVGDGPALDDAKRAAAGLGGAARIHFVGYQKDIFPFLAISDAVLFPTRHPEVLPMFLIEAAAAGLPAVCSDIPGNRDIVDDDGSGFLCAGEDDLYVDRLVRILGDPALAARLGSEARRIAGEKFDRRQVVAATVAMYRALTG